MDLSKFLSTSDNELDDEIEASRKNDIPKNEVLNERIYDSVENLVDKTPLVDEKVRGYFSYLVKISKIANLFLVQSH